jgi:coenzyme F420-reducing hydrogenase alpha subunit
METKPKNIFDHIKNITTVKSEYLGDEGWNNYMINRFLSMNRDYCEVVNFIQKNTWQLKGEYLYNLYKDIIPKQFVRLNYMKSTNVKKYDDREIESVKNYFEISEKEAKEYIGVLSDNELEKIFFSNGQIYKP